VAGHAGLPLFLTDSFFRSEAQGLAEFERSIAGRARIAYELASGQNPFPNEPPATPLNPCGELGVNLSGPPWGSCVLHPVAVCGGMDTSSTMQGERRAVNAQVSSTAWTMFGPWIFFNRPHARLPAPSIAPYDRLYLSILADLASGADVTLSVRCETVDLITGDVIALNEDDATVSTTEGAKFGAGSTAYFDGLGNGHVAIRAQFKHSGSGQSVSINAVSLLNVVKRSH
jgi:hypothetical protein